MKPPHKDAWLNNRLHDYRSNRRAFMRDASLAAGAGLLADRLAWAQMGTHAGTMDIPDASAGKPDYTLEIADIDWEIAPKKKIRTIAYNAQIPGPLLRLTEGRQVSIEIVNRTGHAEIVHWHGQWIPSGVDGAMEEGSPMIPAGSRTLVDFVPRPSGLYWYHTHTGANRALKLGLYTGQAGLLQVDPAGGDPHGHTGSYDQEQYIVLHDWVPYFEAGGDGSAMVSYNAASINGRMLGHAPPIQVRDGQRVLFQILNASATEPHWLALPGHKFKVLALDGAPVATQVAVDLLRLGPAERVTALVLMDKPGIWVLGEPQKEFRDAGMGIVVEYAGRAGKPVEPEDTRLEWDYRVFGDSSPRAYTPDLTIPLVFTSRFKGQGSLGVWMINGKPYPDGPSIPLHQGLRHRLVFDNRSTDDHPIHLHRHKFELVSVHGNPLSGVNKDVVVVEAGTTVEADLIANNPGNTLFHCHQQDHMDAGFMTLFHYA